MVAGIVASWAFAGARIRAAEDEAGRLAAVLNASLLCLIAALTLGKVFSPQYCVWLIPLAAAARAFRRRQGAPPPPLRLPARPAGIPVPLRVALLDAAPATGALIALRTAWFWRYAGAGGRSGAHSGQNASSTAC